MLLHDSESLTSLDYPSLPPNSLTRKVETVGAHCAPVREPPVWRLDYEIGTGACGTVFLEIVQVPRMKSPELWAVKRIPRALPNFTFKRYQAEINNLQALAGVSFAQACVISQPAFGLFNLHHVRSDMWTARMVRQIQLYLRGHPLPVHCNGVYSYGGYIAELCRWLSVE